MITKTEFAEMLRQYVMKEAPEFLLQERIAEIQVHECHRVQEGWGETYGLTSQRLYHPAIVHIYAPELRTKHQFAYSVLHELAHVAHPITEEDRWLNSFGMLNTHGFEWERTMMRFGFLHAPTHGSPKELVDPRNFTGKLWDNISQMPDVEGLAND